MLANNTTIQKFISSLLIISFLVPTILISLPPKQVEAQSNVPVNDSAANLKLGTILKSSGTTAVKETLGWARKLLEIALKLLAKQLLAKMTQAVINWINSDFHGSPLFIENPKSFFGDIAKSEIKFLIDAIGYDTFRFPFGPQTALNVIASYKNQLAINADYTLGKVIHDPFLLTHYQNDFNYGGWNGFLLNTQYPQNNFLGFEGLIQQNLASRLEGTLVAPAQKIQQTLQQGMGFLSPQTCPSNPAYNNGANEFLRPSFQKKTPYNWDTSAAAKINGSYNELEAADSPSNTAYQNEVNRVNSAKMAYDNTYNQAVTAEKSAWSVANTCPGGLVSTTPGSVAANQIFNALDSPRLATALDGAIGNSLAAIFDALINHFLDKGLNAISSVISGGGGSPSADNWSYQGQRLDNSISGSSIGNLNINIPQQSVSVTVNPPGTKIYDTSTVISGGTAPYNIKTQTNGAIATARITRNTGGTTLTISGVKKGDTSVTLTDSSNPQKTVVIQISVNNIGDLVAVPKNVSVNVNSSVNVSISSGGGTPQIIATAKCPMSNPFALADLSSGTNLLIIGVASGVTCVAIQSSPTPTSTDRRTQTIEIPITVNGIGDLTVTPSGPIKIIKGAAAKDYTISGGTGPYKMIQVPDDNFAKAVFKDTGTLTLTGIAEGETIAVITDSSEEKSVTLTIDITADATAVVDNILKIDPSDITVTVGSITGTSVNTNTKNATITGGKGTYFVDRITGSDVTATIINGTTLKITAGYSDGPATVTVKDGSGNTAQAFITVKPDPSILRVDPSPIYMKFGATIRAKISGGMGPYKITAVDSDVAKLKSYGFASNDNTTLVIVANTSLNNAAKTETGIQISDSSYQIVNIRIHVDP